MFLWRWDGVNTTLIQIWCGDKPLLSDLDTKPRTETRTEKIGGIRMRWKKDKSNDRPIGTKSNNDKTPELKNKNLTEWWRNPNGWLQPNTMTLVGQGTWRLLYGVPIAPTLWRRLTHTSTTRANWTTMHTGHSSHKSSLLEGKTINVVFNIKVWGGSGKTTTKAALYRVHKDAN